MVGRQQQGARAQLNVSVATFIPKPQTAFQWAALCWLMEKAGK